MASAAVKERLIRIGQGVLDPTAGLAALAAIFRTTATAARPSGAPVRAVNPFVWRTYLSNMKVNGMLLLYGQCRIVLLCRDSVYTIIAVQ